jgi:hypothetical protein
MGISFSWFQIVFGSVYLVLGLRTKSPWARIWGPFGLWFMLAGAFRLLEGRLPDAVLIAVAVSSFAATGLWFIRTIRASKTHPPDAKHD